MCTKCQQNFPKVIADAHGSSTAKSGGAGGEQGCGQPPPPDRVPAVRSCRCASGSFGRTPGGSHHGLTTEEEEEEDKEKEKEKEKQKEKLEEEEGRRRRRGNEKEEGDSCWRARPYPIFERPRILMVLRQERWGSRATIVPPLQR